MNQDFKKYDENLKKIVNYIQQETQKKIDAISKEIEKDEDLEKIQFIEPEKVKITKRMDKELEQYQTKMKIERSQKMNKLRLEKLKVKIDCMNQIYEESKSKLAEKIKGDPNKYKEVLQSLIVQGLIKLLDDNINIICKKAEYDIVLSLVEPAKEQFLDIIKQQARKGLKVNPKITVDSNHFLPEEIIGGVFLTSLKNKIRVDNTLDKRLELLKLNSTPIIRKILFEDDEEQETEKQQQENQEINVIQESQEIQEFQEKQESS